MKYSKNKTYAPPVAESVTLYTEQCMQDSSSESSGIPNLGTVDVIDELGL